MLKHDEIQDLPAAHQRVTAEELSRAVSALDEARAAEQINGTAPIGQVVEELNLDATPDEIWAQVQRQRAEGAAKTSAKTSIISPAARRRVWGQREDKGLALLLSSCSVGLGLFWYSGGLGHRNPIPLASAHAGVEIRGDNQTLTSATAGKPVEISGDNDTLTLTSDCPVLTISGDGNHVRVQGRVGKVIADGDSNVVTFTTTPAPVLSGDGSGNRVGPEH